MWDAAVLVGVAQVLGDTHCGLTGPEIEALLKLLNIPDPGRITKWKRLEAALAGPASTRQVAQARAHLHHRGDEAGALPR
jgi:hypothetical protein